ncbi:MAG TPA: HNH endonuclease [Nevskiaceae bacterium]|nr:HNH endonuclease [Nevskiaceae bacterium]
MSYRAYTPDEIRDAVKVSIADCLRRLGLQPRGGNYQTIKKRVDQLGLDVSHFTGSTWNKGMHRPPDRIRARSKLRAALIRHYGHRCWECGNSEWRGRVIPLEVEHVDGDSANNALANLRLLCCNCHALTSTWRRRKSSLRADSSATIAHDPDPAPGF